MPAFLSRRSGFLLGVLALAAGGLWCMAFAPWSMPGLGLIGLTAGFALMTQPKRPARAALLGFLFGFAAFFPGLSWTVRSMHEFGRLALPLAWLGAGLLAAVCALFWSAAAAAAAKLLPAGSCRWILLALFLSLAEWLRGAGFIDFGWLTPALGVLDTPLGGLAPLGGTHLINLAVFTAAGGLGAALCGLLRGRFSAAAFLLLPACFLAVGFWSSTREWSAPGETVTLRLVQPDLPVVDGWTRPDSAARLDAAAKFMSPLWGPEAGAKATLTPEGILSSDAIRRTERLSAALGRFIEAAGGPVLFNGFRRGDAWEWFNTSFFAQPDKKLVLTDKRKLVPFGEFVPSGFRWFVDLLGIPLADLTPGNAVQSNISLGAGVRAGILICYENIDGEVLRSFWRDPQDAPGLFFVTANLGWFSPSVISQHLDMTRLLARSSARPAASVNMNGSSAIVSARGENLAQAPPAGSAVLEHQTASAAGEPTPFVRFGNLPAMGLWLAIGLALFGAQWMKRRQSLR